MTNTAAVNNHHPLASKMMMQRSKQQLTGTNRDQISRHLANGAENFDTRNKQISEDMAQIHVSSFFKKTAGAQASGKMKQ